LLPVDTQQAGRTVRPFLPERRSYSAKRVM
jgi:hypothetical protein